MEKPSSGLADVAKYGTYKEFAFFDKVSFAEHLVLQKMCTRKVASLSFLPRDAMLACVCCSRVSACLSQVGVLLKRLNIGSCKQCRMIAQGL